MNDEDFYNYFQKVAHRGDEATLRTLIPMMIRRKQVEMAKSAAAMDKIIGPESAVKVIKEKVSELNKLSNNLTDLVILLKKFSAGDGSIADGRSITIGYNFSGGRGNYILSLTNKTKEAKGKHAAFIDRINNHIVALIHEDINETYDKIRAIGQDL